jgi:hypothetical protein
MLKNIDRINDHLQTIEPCFYGRIAIKVWDGKTVMITEERETRLDDERQDSTKRCTEKGR